jgi:hypothetical protein
MGIIRSSNVLKQSNTVFSLFDVTRRYLKKSGSVPKKSSQPKVKDPTKLFLPSQALVRTIIDILAGHSREESEEVLG